MSTERNVHMTGDATVETARSADGTTIAFERSGTGPRSSSSTPHWASAASARWGCWPRSCIELHGHYLRPPGSGREHGHAAVCRRAGDRGSAGARRGRRRIGVHVRLLIGAVLLLHAALAGIAFPRLVLLEPPLALDDEPDQSNLGAEIAELVAAGRRGDAVEHFNKSIGVPEEMLAGIRDAPFWPTLEQAAHTLVYDTTITSSLPLDRVSGSPLRSSSSPARGVTSACRPGGAGSATASGRLASHARGRMARRRAGGPRYRADGVLHPEQRDLGEESRTRGQPPEETDSARKRLGAGRCRLGAPRSEERLLSLDPAHMPLCSLHGQLLIPAADRRMRAAEMERIWNAAVATNKNRRGTRPRESRAMRD